MGGQFGAARRIGRDHRPALAGRRGVRHRHHPEDADAGHWRGRFFARQGCEGEDGSFHCELGDCGPYIDHCEVDEQPVSLAEFNFDAADEPAPGTTSATSTPCRSR
ncbi:thaumatin family protein [Streptomyces sp. M19]